MYKIVYEWQAVKDIPNLKTARLDKKVQELIEVVRRNPFQNPPPFETLRGNLTGLYSRRINIQHRFVYQVYPGEVAENNMIFDGVVKIIRMWSHYEKV